LNIPGFVDYLNEKDLQGPNLWGPFVPNEVHFATDEVILIKHYVIIIIISIKNYNTSYGHGVCYLYFLLNMNNKINFSFL